MLPLFLEKEQVRQLSKTQGGLSQDTARKRLVLESARKEERAKRSKTGIVDLTDGLTELVQNQINVTQATHAFNADLFKQAERKAKEDKTQKIFDNTLILYNISKDADDKIKMEVFQKKMTALIESMQAPDQC